MSRDVPSKIPRGGLPRIGMDIDSPIGRNRDRSQVNRFRVRYPCAGQASVKGSVKREPGENPELSRSGDGNETLHGAKPTHCLDRDGKRQWSRQPRVRYRPAATTMEALAADRGCARVCRSRGVEPVDTAMLAILWRSCLRIGGSSDHRREPRCLQVLFLPSSLKKLKTANLGFPRMGRQRELKFALEGF